jgi:hypothetical protein
LRHLWENMMIVQRGWICLESGGKTDHNR